MKKKYKAKTTKVSYTGVSFLTSATLGYLHDSFNIFILLFSVLIVVSWMPKIFERWKRRQSKRRLELLIVKTQEEADRARRNQALAEIKVQEEFRQKLSQVYISTNREDYQGHFILKEG